MEARVHLIISGRVQGVFFRANTRKTAKDLGLKGWVRNLPGGEVEVVAEGRKPALERLIEFCRKGPEGAHVENANVEWERPKGGFTSFDVKF